LQTHGRINRSDVMQQFNISTRTASRILADIANEGLIIRKGAGRDSHFVLPPPT
jgi:predicted transcriptional regulator